MSKMYPVTKKHALQTITSIIEQKQHGKMCDVILIAGEDNKKFSAHRLILSTWSQYFSAMFTCNMRESQEKEVIIHGVAGNILEQIINYCYTGKADINENNAEDLLTQATLMMFPTIVESCADFLIKQLSHENCVAMFTLADHLRCETLLNGATDFIKERYQHILMSKDLLHLTEDQLIKFITIKGTRPLFFQESLFKAVLKWIKLDETNRKTAMPKLLPHLKLHLMERSYIDIDIKEALNDFVANQYCYEVIKSAIKCKNYPKYVLVLTNQFVKKYYPETNEVEFLTSLKRCGPNYGAALIGEKLVVICTICPKRKDVLKYMDLNTNLWYSLPQMNSIRECFSIAVLGGYMYAIGGKGYYEGTSLNIVERYDSITNKWHTVAKLHVKRQNAGCAVLNGKIYVLGGHGAPSTANNHREELNTMECYDAKSNTWTLRAPLNVIEGNVSVVATEKYLFAFGTKKYISPSIIERYDPVNDQWKVMAELRSRRLGMGVCRYEENKILIFGGYRGITARQIPTIELYNPEENRSDYVSCGLGSEVRGSRVFCYPVSKELSNSIEKSS